MNLRRLATALALSAALIVCWRAAEMRPTVLFAPGTSAAVWAFISSLFPPDLSPYFLRVVVAALIRTAALAIAGTTLAIAIGLPLGVLSTPTLWQRGVILAGRSPGGTKTGRAWASRRVRAPVALLPAAS